MKRINYLLGAILCFCTILSSTAQNIDEKGAKTQRKKANIEIKKNSERDPALQERIRQEKQNFQTTGKKSQSIDFETLKKLKRDEVERKRGNVSSKAVQKSDRSFSSPNTASYGKRAASTNKFSEAEIEAMKQQKEAQKPTKIKLEKKGMAASSQKIVKTPYTKASLRKNIADLEQKLFCAEENNTEKTAELEKIKKAISNREMLLKTLD